MDQPFHSSAPSYVRSVSGAAKSKFLAVDIRQCLLAVAAAVVFGWGTTAWADAPTPKVDRVVALEQDPAVEAPGVFFKENFKTIKTLSDQFGDTAEGEGKFNVTSTNAFSGSRSLEQAYIARDTYKEQDKGEAGWVIRHFDTN